MGSPWAASGAPTKAVSLVTDGGSDSICGKPPLSGLVGSSLSPSRWSSVAPGVRALSWIQGISTQERFTGSRLREKGEQMLTRCNQLLRRAIKSFSCCCQAAPSVAQVAKLGTQLDARTSSLERNHGGCRGHQPDDSHRPKPSRLAVHWVSGDRARLLPPQRRQPPYSLRVLPDSCPLPAPRRPRLHSSIARTPWIGASC